MKKFEKKNPGGVTKELPKEIPDELPRNSMRNSREIFEEIPKEFLQGFRSNRWMNCGITFIKTPNTFLKKLWIKSRRKSPEEILDKISGGVRGGHPRRNA